MKRRFIALWQASRDAVAGHRLISSHLRLVISITNSFRRYGLSFDDLISEGCVGLMQAVDRFDSARQCRLSTYAKWWIRAAMQEHIMRTFPLGREKSREVGQLYFIFGNDYARMRKWYVRAIELNYMRAYADLG